MRRLPTLLAAILLAAASASAEESKKSPEEPAPMPATVTPMDSSELVDFAKNPGPVRTLLEACLTLTKQSLRYKFGSSDPADGGMDCSGTIYYVLRSVGIDDVPRTASDQYVWARKADNFQAVVSRDKDSFELDDLKPGDLLFWTGTYSTDRDPPVTHTMIYLGTLKSDGRQVMFGSSDGRSFGGKKMWGVSVFDFTIPKAKAKPAQGESALPGSVFIGYSRIPGLDRAAVSSATVAKSDDAPSPEPTASPTPSPKKVSKNAPRDDDEPAPQKRHKNHSDE